MATEPSTLQEAIVYFSDPVNCREFLVSRRWPNGVECPRCGSQTVIFQSKYNRWQCSAGHDRRQFTSKTGTIMEDSPIGLDKWLMAMWQVVNLPAPRSQEHLAHDLPYANDVDVFVTDFDRRLYRLMLKYGLKDTHLMDTHISVVNDDDQDKRVFLKQIEIGKLEALLIMGGPNSKVWRTVQRYLEGWNGMSPRMYKMWHYTYRFPSDERWEKVFASALTEIATNHPNLRRFLLVPHKSASPGVNQGEDVVGQSEVCNWFCKWIKPQTHAHK